MGVRRGEMPKSKCRRCKGKEEWAGTGKPPTGGGRAGWSELMSSAILPRSDSVLSSSSSTSSFPSSFLIRLSCYLHHSCVGVPNSNPHFCEAVHFPSFHHLHCPHHSHLHPCCHPGPHFPPAFWPCFFSDSITTVGFSAMLMAQFSQLIYIIELLNISFSVSVFICMYS